ncbi:MAG TPA: aminopeptidase, partial [Pyrinomonadaceae bacterium]|nr:aminopeptidase [Pyrinomonadaceae bacterium]
MNTKLVAALALALAALVSACPTANAPVSNNASSPTNTTADNTNAAANSSPAKTTAKTAVPTDLNKLAERIVTQSAGVKEGEIVLIGGGVRDFELLENIVTEVQKAGGHPFLEIFSERMAKRSYTDVPEKYDTQEPKLGMALAKIVNVTITVDSTETEGLLSDVPPARRA